MTLRRINNFLLAAILLVNGYVVIMPIIPGFMFWLQSHNHAEVQRIQAEANLAPPPSSSTPTPTSDRLIIPSMLLDEPINEGNSTATLSKGLWRLPQSSTPDKGSNTVIAGHRFTYSNPEGTLYNLNKVQVGDLISVWWNGRLYKYRADTIEVVGPNDVSVEAPTQSPQLTIYTCTPLWLPKNRLVVIAKPEGQ